MIIIGLTGGIASGKSTVSNMLRNRGIPIIDADKIAREIVEIGSMTLQNLVDEFGADILLDDGQLNRRKLREIIFNDESKLKRLNEITHPKIKERIEEQILCYNKLGYNLCVVDAALLIEANFIELVDYTIVIYVDFNTQIDRLMKRDNITREDALKIINAQMNLEEKIKFADFVVDNSKDLEYTTVQINKIISSIETLEECNE